MPSKLTPNFLIPTFHIAVRMPRANRFRQVKRLFRIPILVTLEAKELLKRHFGSFRFEEVLPIGFEILRGAISVGNDSTPSILTANFKRATGSYNYQMVCIMNMGCEGCPAHDLWLVTNAGKKQLGSLQAGLSIPIHVRQDLYKRESRSRRRSPRTRVDCHWRYPTQKLFVCSSAICLTSC
jgi:hypothetical protein